MLALITRTIQQSLALHTNFRWLLGSTRQAYSVDHVVAMANRRQGAQRWPATMNGAHFYSVIQILVDPFNK